MMIKKLSLLFLVLFLFSSACVPETPTPVATEPPATVSPVSDAVVPVELQTGYGWKDGWFEVYFTDPFNPFSSQINGGVDGPLVDAIDAARQTVDMAAYSLSLNSVRNALINAHRRGVTVRVVMESENIDNSDPQKLIDAGIEVLGDRREGLMHDKFIVIDRGEVWMGSMNFTDGGAYKDNNNLVRIVSEEIAANYTKEFEEMFVDDMFGPDTVAETPNPEVEIDGTPVQNYFSPDDGVAEKVLPLLNGAEKSIYFMAYSFTRDDFGQAIVDRAAQGVVVKGVMDDSQVSSNQGTEYDVFAQNSLDVRLDGNDGLMHHKVFIIDERYVVFGSYNFSASAEEKNDENIIIVDNPEFAKLFLDEFARVYDKAQVP